jgi:hypothetical protein
MEIMVAQLIPPMKERLLRKVDPNFVKALKTNMIRDPTGTGVPPAVVFTNQMSPKEFNISLKDAYKLVFKYIGKVLDLKEHLTLEDKYIWFPTSYVVLHHGLYH